MKLDDYNKKRLSLTIIRFFSQMKRNHYINYDILQEFEIKTPKSIMEKLTGDVNDRKSEVGEFDRDAQRLIRKFFRELPEFVNKCIVGTPKETNE